AAVAIAEKLAKQDPKLANEVGTKVLEQCKHPEIVKRAQALCGQLPGTGSFIQDWLVCGPFRQADAVGAAAVFPMVFPPEKPGEKVQWKHAPRADMIDLATLFPGEENCAAYLKTWLISAQDRGARLFIGSDDGVKAWLNGVVV